MEHNVISSGLPRRFKTGDEFICKDGSKVQITEIAVEVHPFAQSVTRVYYNYEHDGREGHESNDAKVFIQLLKGDLS